MKEIIKAILNKVGLLIYIKKILKFDLKKSKEYPIIKYSYEKFIFSNRSSLIWTTHKGASSVVTKILKNLEKKINFGYFDYESKICKYSKELDKIYDPNDLLEEYNDIFFQRFNNIYGPLRKPYEIDYMNSYNHIFILRDPRDVLISSYYWFGYNAESRTPEHYGLHNMFVKRRDKIQSLSKDDACIYLADEWLLDIYAKYLEIYKKYENTFFIPYKFLKSNPDFFLESFFKASGVNDKKGTLKKLAQEVLRKKPSKNDLKHRRSGKSNQYLTELQPQTIENLNSLFNPILNAWDF